MKKILFILTGTLTVLILSMSVSCVHHHFGGSKNELHIQNEKGQDASAPMRLHREHPWYRHLFNPVGLSYHPRYLAEESLIEGQITLEHIHDGDKLRVYVRRDILPLHITFTGGDTNKFLINWELIGKRLEKSWESELQSEQQLEQKAFTLMDPQNAAIVLVWLRKEGQWSFQGASWVAQDRHSLQRLDRDAEELSKKAASTTSPASAP